MGLISDVLGSDARGVKKKSWASLSAFFDSVSGYGTNKKASIREQTESFRSWVYICCNVIQKRVSEIPFRFYRIDTGEEIKPSSRGIYPTINRIFVDPNGYQEWRSLISYVQLSLDLYGMAFLLRVDDALGKPWQLHPLNTTKLYRIVKGEKLYDWIKAFAFTFEDGPKYFKPENILYFHYINPSDPRLGFSVIQGQAAAVSIDGYLEKYESAFFQNSARPDIVLSYPENVVLEEDEAKRIIEDWRKKFRGVDKAHQITITDQGAKIEKLTVQNSDLALNWLAQWTADKILSAYGVPPSSVGIIRDVNKNSAQATNESFNSESILPRLRLLEEVLTRGVLQRFDKRLALKFDSPVPRDKEELIKEHKVKVGVPSVTINESRESEGQKKVKGGDKIFVPLNFVPLTSQRPSRGDDDV